MAIKEIITHPDPVLRQECKRITEFNKELERLAADMAETMYAAPGIGLAANQIGVAEQLIVVDISTKEKEKKYISLVNPQIEAGEGSVVDEEGCLSVIDYTAKVKRFQKIKVKAQDLKGEELSFEATDRFARIIQHEVDHLHGKLFLDRLSSLKRNLYKRKLAKILRNQE